VSGQGEGGGRGKWPYRATVVMIATAVIAAGVASVFAFRSDDQRAPTAAEEPTTTTSTTAPSNEITEPPPPARHRLASDASRGWDLLLVEGDPRNCLELVVGQWKQDSVLCDARPAPKLIGDVAALNTPLGRIVVAVVDPSVTALDPGVGTPGRAARHPDDPALAYAAAPAGAGESGHLPELMLHSDEHTIGRILLPVKAGLITPAEMTIMTDKPYGRWPGYRKAGYTGLFFGGNQVVGFYDGPGDRTCVLYRRLGSRWEEVLVDACPERAPNDPLAFAALVPTPPLDTPAPETPYILLAVTDRPVSQWQCRLPSSASCGGDHHDVFADPSGSGRTALAQFIGMVTPGPHDHVELVITSSGETLHAKVPVPR
jgi:hypothetical protein